MEKEIREKWKFKRITKYMFMSITKLEKQIRKEQILWGFESLSNMYPWFILARKDMWEPSNLDKIEFLKICEIRQIRLRYEMMKMFRMRKT